LRLKDTSDEIRTMGAHGIAALGTNAPADVVPRLVEIARKHPDERGRYLAVFAVRTLGPAAESAIPFLVECLTNREPTIRDEAAIALGSVGRPEIAVPVLVRYIEFARNLPSSYEARDALESLGRIGTNARSAVPVFLSFLDHPNVDTRRTVTNCFPSVDAEAAAKAGVKRVW
jgi:HEAT repeat protein